MSPVSVEYGLMDCPEARKDIRKVLNEQYDILKVPENDRKYICQDPEVAAAYLDHISLEYGYKVVKSGEGNIHLSEETAKKLGLKSAEGLCLTDKVEGASLALCRILLGLNIITDLEIDGYCNLNAEL